MNFPLVPLSDVTTVIAGQSPPGHTYNDNGVGLPFFQGKTDFGEVHPIARKWCTAPKKIAERGDILISVRAPVGPTNVADSRCCIGRGLAAIRPDGTVALRDFVLWSLRHRETKLVAMGQGSTFAAINQKNLKSLQIPLPPLDEQRRIVGILNRAAKIERLRRQSQELLQEFIPALFNKMFGDPATNPKGWQEYPLGEVIRVSSGQGLSAKHMKPGIFPVYGGNGIAGYHSEFMFEDSKIVIGRVGANCGTVHLSRPKSWITDNALYVREIRKPVELTYLEWSLRVANLNQYAGRAAQPLVSGSRIYPVPIMLPDKTTQREFAQIVETADSSSRLVMSGTRIADKFTKSLMSRLLGAST